MSLLKRIISFNVRLTKLIDQKKPDFVKERNYKDQLLLSIKKVLNQCNHCSVLEVGGIDRPLLERSEKMRYDGLDIEYKEQCSHIYDNYFVQSIEEPVKCKYDLIISMTLLEHVQDNNASVTQIYQALKPGGYAIHYLPSKYHPYSLILRLVSPRCQKRLIRTFRFWAEEVTGYPSFFDRCSPKEMRKLFKNKGFKHVTTTSFFRANVYFRFFLPFYILVTLWENICKRLQFEQLCSGFIITARK